MHTAQPPQLWPFGVLALLCYASHAGIYIARGQPANLLWTCHIATVLIGLGLLLRAPKLNAIGTLWLSVGTPLWFLDLAMGLEFVPTSTLTHIVGLGLGLYGLRQLGVPHRSSGLAVVALALLVLLSRIATPPQENVNLAHRVHGGWEATFPSHGTYLALLTFAIGAAFFGLEKLAQAIPRPETYPLRAR